MGKEAARRFEGCHESSPSSTWNVADGATASATSSTCVLDSSTSAGAVRLGPVHKLRGTLAQRRSLLQRVW